MLNKFEYNVEQETRHKLKRILFASIIFSIVFINSITNFAVNETEVECIIDYSHILFNLLNRFFYSHSYIKNFCQILIGLIIDINFLVISYIFISNCKKWKTLVIPIHFLIFKILCNFLFQTNYQDHSLFEYPGFPSILISYKYTYDSFFSSLTGLNLIFANELRILKNEKDYIGKNFLYIEYLTIICYSNIPFKIIFDISIRSHYIIDEITAVVLAHYCILSSDEISYFLDKHFPLDSFILCEENSKNMIELNLLEKSSDFNNLEIEVVEEKYF